MGLRFTPPDSPEGAEEPVEEGAASCRVRCIKSSKMLLLKERQHKQMDL